MPGSSIFLRRGPWRGGGRHARQQHISPSRPVARRRSARPPSEFFSVAARGAAEVGMSGSSIFLRRGPWRGGGWLAMRYAMLRWGIACGTISPQKLLTAMNPSDGLTKYLTGKPLRTRARVLRCTRSHTHGSESQLLGTALHGTAQHCTALHSTSASLGASPQRAQGTTGRRCPRLSPGGPRPQTSIIDTRPLSAGTNPRGECNFSRGSPRNTYALHPEVIEAPHATTGAVTPIPPPGHTPIWTDLYSVQTRDPLRLRSLQRNHSPASRSLSSRKR